ETEVAEGEELDNAAGVVGGVGGFGGGGGGEGIGFCACWCFDEFFAGGEALDGELRDVLGGGLFQRDDVAGVDHDPLADFHFEVGGGGPFARSGLVGV